MAEVESEKTTTLAQQYSLQGKMEEPDKAEQSDEGGSGTAAQSTNDDSPANVAPEEVVEEKNEETPAAAGENSAAEESSEAPEQEETAVEESVEQTPEIKLETAPVDFRFPTTNQTRHCFARYIEYHRCIGAKGEGAPECEKFAKYYRSLCPGEWIDRWNEQRENGTFPGPL